MSKRYTTRTAWQTAKPIVRRLLGGACVPAGFTGPGLTMHRYRRDFVDMIHASSTNGYNIVLGVGCDPRRLLKGYTPSGENACLLKPATMLWSNQSNRYTIPNHAGAIHQIVETEVLPQIVVFLDEWFPLFPDVDTAIDLVSKSTEVAQDAHPGSPTHRFVLFALRRARAVTQSVGQDWCDSGLPPIAGMEQM